ncbi:MAG TPA: hypothetical protein VGU03_12705 [Frateuria sp.]|uniref:hypothetical protein n=1 Tax=Frateuria sp. TaxID=2211372 RepID=UPI002DEC0626|nr:hypothetical protein [Frateuria sp.]
MEHLLRVTLDKSTQPWTVDIDQNGNANHIDRSPQPQTIVWQLEGDAANGQLQPLNWVDTPPDGVFGPAEPSSNGKSMQMTDLNKDAASSGDWVYQLSVALDGQTYSTLDTTGTNSNPSIKNN